jgi:hypothetical protein
MVAMVTQMTHSVISLEPGQAYALPRRDRQTICALDHPLWLSQQGRHEDVVVATGDCVTLPGRGLIVAQAFGERTTFRVAHAATLRDRLAAFARRHLHDTPTPRRAPRASAAERQRPFLSAVWPP